MKIGARCYLLKTLLDKELLETIRAVLATTELLTDNPVVLAKIIDDQELVLADPPR
jgi:hypothetical protein